MAALPAHRAGRCHRRIDDRHAAGLQSGQPLVPEKALERDGRDLGVDGRRSAGVLADRAVAGRSARMARHLSGARLDAAGGAGAHPVVALAPDCRRCARDRGGAQAAGRRRQDLDGGSGPAHAGVLGALWRHVLYFGEYLCGQCPAGGLSHRVGAAATAGGLDLRAGRHGLDCRHLPCRQPGRSHRRDARGDDLLWLDHRRCGGACGARPLARHGHGRDFRDAVRHDAGLARAACGGAVGSQLRRRTPDRHLRRGALWHGHGRCARLLGQRRALRPHRRLLRRLCPVGRRGGLRLAALRDRARITR